MPSVEDLKEKEKVTNEYRFFIRYKPCWLSIQSNMKCRGTVYPLRQYQLGNDTAVTTQTSLVMVIWEYPHKLVGSSFCTSNMNLE